MSNPLNFPGLFQYDENVDTDPCVVYLISSGNNDDVHKIGMTSNIERRIEQVRLKYEVPNAEVVATIPLTGRARALGVEHMLHWDWNHRRNFSYIGNEFFTLKDKDLIKVLIFFNAPLPDPKPVPEPELETEEEQQSSEPEFVLEQPKPFRLFGRFIRAVTGIQS